jgi:hypothetical protein
VRWRGCEGASIRRGILDGHPTRQRCPSQSWRPPSRNRCAGAAASVGTGAGIASHSDGLGIGGGRGECRRQQVNRSKARVEVKAARGRAGARPRGRRRHQSHPPPPSACPQVTRQGPGGDDHREGHGDRLNGAYNTERAGQAEAVDPSDPGGEVDPTPTPSGFAVFWACGRGLDHGAVTNPARLEGFEDPQGPRYAGGQNPRPFPPNPPRGSPRRTSSRGTPRCPRRRPRGRCRSA